MRKGLRAVCWEVCKDKITPGNLVQLFHTCELQS